MVDFVTLRSTVLTPSDRCPRWRKALAWLGAVAMLCCLASAALAADHPAMLQVSIVNEKNQPIADAEVSVSQGDNPVSATVTDKNG